MKENPFGRISTLHLTASVSERSSQSGQAETYLKEMSFTAPYKVLSPFKREDGSIEVMILAVSAGIMEGDTQQIELETETGAVMECTSQSFEKIHKMNEGCAKRETQIRAADDSTLIYRPLPVIPFAVGFCEQDRDPSCGREEQDDLSGDSLLRAKCEWRAICLPQIRCKNSGQTRGKTDLPRELSV